MKAPIAPAAMPRDGLIAAHLTDTDFFDAYALPLARTWEADRRGRG